MPRDDKRSAGASRRPRGSLSEEEIIAAAIMIVERDGLDALSMPALAKHLGAGVMSIYWYFRNKDELLVAMTDRAVHDAFADVPPPGGGTAAEETVRLYLAFYRSLQRAPLFLRLCRAKPELLLPRPAIVPAIAKRWEAELEVVRRLGTDPLDAMRLHSILSGYTVGFVLMEHGVEPVDGHPAPEQALEQALAQADPDKYPALRSLRHAGAVVAINDDAFETGLRLLVDGILAAYAPA